MALTGASVKHTRHRRKPRLVRRLGRAILASEARVVFQKNSISSSSEEMDSGQDDGENSRLLKSKHAARTS